MKTLLVTLEYPPVIGGIASYTYNLAKHLTPSDLVVYAPKDARAKEFDAANPWKTYRFEPLFGWLFPRWLRAYFQIRRLVKKEKIDIVHLHHVLPMGQVARLINRWQRLPYVVYLHGSDLVFATKTKSKQKSLRSVCKSAQSIVVNSEYCKNELLKIIESHPDIRIVYPCPADELVDYQYSPGEINSLKAQLALNGRKVILSVSRLVERKGHALFVPAYLKILAKIPNAIWVIVGDGPEKKYLNDLILKNNLQSVVRFLPSQNAEELGKLYSCADLFALLTHLDRDGVNEAWGMVFLEAAAFGVPSLAGRSGGVEEAVVDGVTGFIVDAHNPEQIAATTVEALQKLDYIRNIGQAAKERVLSEMRWSKQLTKISDLSTVKN